MAPYYENSGAQSNQLPTIVDAANFITKEIIPPKELVKGLIHQGSKLTIGGSSKAGKTWVLLDLAISVAHGLEWLGLPTEQGRVLYMNYEIQEWAWQKRIQEVCAAKKTQIVPDKLHLLNLRGYGARIDDLVSQLKARMGSDFALIVLDPIYKVYGEADENKAGDVAKLLNALEHLAVSSGAAVAFAAHFSKGNQANKESLDRISGSGVFTRDPDSLLTLTANAADKAFTVEATLRNFPPIQPFCIRWQYPLMVRDESLDPADLRRKGRKRQYTTEQLVSALNGVPLRPKEWFATVRKKVPRMSQRTFDNLKAELVAQGHVEDTPEGYKRKEIPQ